ncbi:MAG TPA: hypothetical protein VMV54_06070 [Acidocella sp.]|nr:hypothetical protein [Acidocella sp.]
MIRPIPTTTEARASLVRLESAIATYHDRQRAERLARPSNIIAFPRSPAVNDTTPTGPRAA